MGEIRQQTLRSAKWSYFGSFSIKGIQFAVGIILARMLTPSDYGLIGMISIFTAIASTFVDSGMSNALIRKKDASNADFCTVFYFNIIVSVIAYFILFICAPFIAIFFKEPILKDVIRVISLNLVIGSLGAVHIARFTKILNFKINALLNVTSSIISGAVGIALAYLGYGVWSLVFQSISYNIVNVIMNWIASRWHPLIIFSKSSFKDLFGYGSKLLLSNLLHTVYTNLTTLLIGKFYTPSQLGYYSRGENFPNLIEGTVAGPLMNVTFPIMAKYQDDDKKLISIYRNYIKLFSLIICFILILLATLAKPIIIILLTDKWLLSVPYMQIFCFVSLTVPISNINLTLLQVKGRSDLFLRLEIIKKTISVIMLLCAVPWGVMAICIMKLIYSQIAVFINTYYTGKLLNLGYWEQAKDFGPYIIFSAIACIPAFILTFTEINALIVCILGCISAIVIYFIILRLSNDSILTTYILPVLKSKLQFLREFKA